MKRLITDAQLVEIIAQSRAWRFTQLAHEITDQTGCSEATAHRMIKRGRTLGFLERRQGTYQLHNHAAEPAGYHYHAIDRLALLRLIAERPSWRYNDLFDTIATRRRVSQSSARTSFRYARDYNYLKRRGRGWALTQRCRDQLAQYGRLEGAEGFRFATCLSGQPKRGFARWSNDPPKWP